MSRARFSLRCRVVACLAVSTSVVTLAVAIVTSSPAAASPPSFTSPTPSPLPVSAAPAGQAPVEAREPVQVDSASLPTLSGGPVTSPVSAPSQGFNATTSKVDGRSVNSTDFVNADGSHTAMLSPAPTNYQGPDGSWQPINDEVESDSAQAGGLTNTANSLSPVSFRTSVASVRARATSPPCSVSMACRASGTFLDKLIMSEVAGHGNRA